MPGQPPTGFSAAVPFPGLFRAPGYRAQGGLAEWDPEVDSMTGMMLMAMPFFSCSPFLLCVPLSTEHGGSCHPWAAALPRGPGRSSIPATWSWTTSLSSFLLSQDVFSPFCDCGCAREEAPESWNVPQHRLAKLLQAAAWTDRDELTYFSLHF